MDQACGRGTCIGSRGSGPISAGRRDRGPREEASVMLRSGKSLCGEDSSAECGVPAWQELSERCRRLLAREEQGQATGWGSAWLLFGGQTVGAGVGKSGQGGICCGGGAGQLSLCRSGFS